MPLGTFFVSAFFYLSNEIFVFNMLRNRLLLFFLFFQSVLSSQTVQKDSLPNAYREDQIYIGISFISLLSDEDNFNQNGLSSAFQFGFVRDMPLIASGKLALGVGIGYGQQQFNSNLLRVTDGNLNSYYVLQNLEEAVDKMKFSFKSLVFPLSIRWRTSTPTNFQFWRIYGGIKFRWNFSAKATQKNETLNIISDTQPWTTEGFLSVGFNTWNLYLGYEFRSLFSADIQSESSDLLDVRALKFGLIFYLL